ncbi:MAG: hypothetical protein ACOZNI_28665 [Myxococcota bacterium]
MSATIAGALQKGVTLRDLLPRLAALHEAGKPLQVQVESRSVPYLDHTVVGWTDGPPTSSVAFVLSGEAPDHAHWRRFTISKAGPWRWELECFPTPFPNGEDPLSPGIPPSAARRR